MRPVRKQDIWLCNQAGSKKAIGTGKSSYRGELEKDLVSDLFFDIYKDRYPVSNIPI